jgi:hypothetical protein
MSKVLPVWTTPDPLMQYHSGYIYCGNNPISFFDPDGLWSQTDSGYYTNDPADITRFYNYLVGTPGASMNDVNRFITSEMSPVRAGIYEDQWGAHFLEAAKMVGSPGNWKKDEASWNRIRGFQADHAAGMLDSDYHQRFFNPVIAAVYQGQNNFMYHPVTQGVIQVMAAVMTAGIANYAGSIISGGSMLTHGAKAVSVGTRGAYSVYKGVDAAKNLRYVGITGRAPAVRFAEHAASGTARSGLYYETRATGLTKTAARVMEQNYINSYGLQKNGGALLNKINSIAPNNWYKYSGLIP